MYTSYIIYIYTCKNHAMCMYTLDVCILYVSYMYNVFLYNIALYMCAVYVCTHVE